jgi:hypothetical protein
MRRTMPLYEPLQRRQQFPRHFLNLGCIPLHS